MSKYVFALFALLAAAAGPLTGAEYVHNGRFMNLEYRADLNRHRIQPYWQCHPKNYSNFRLVKDVEADVARSYLNVKSLKAPADGYDKLRLDTEFTAVPHAVVSISFKARGSGRVAAQVYEYMLEENGKQTYLARAADLPPQSVDKDWRQYRFDYVPRQGELGKVKLRFLFTPTSGDALDIDLGDVSAEGKSAPRPAVPATLTIPKLAAAPDLAKSGDWAGALRIGGFKNNYTGLPDDGRMEVKLGYDDQNLYLGFHSDTGEPPLAQFTGRDSTVFRDDSAEAVFTDMEDRAFAQIIINSLNAIYDIDARSGNPNAWNPAIRSAAGKTDSGWWANLAVPRAEMPFPLKEEEPFKVNFLQTDTTLKGGGKRKLAGAWSHACPEKSHLRAADTQLFPVARLSGRSIAAGVAPLASGELELMLQNPGEAAFVYCEYGSASFHRGTVKVAAPRGEHRFKLPYVPDNELAVIVVRDAAGREIYRNAENFQHRLESHLGLRSYLPLNYVELASDITSLPEYRLRWALEGIREGVFDIKGKAENLRIDIGDVPPDKPVKLRVRILGPAGNSLGERTFPILRPKREPWSQSTLGITDTPLPPFTAIRQDKDGLAFLQTAMRFEGRALPAAVSSQDHELLAGPVTLSLDGKDIAGAKRTITSAKPNRVEWTAENDFARWTGWAEEDGFTWYTVTLKADPGKTVADLHLDIPLRKEYAKLLNPNPFFRSGGDMDGRWSFDGKPWTSLDFKQILTLRNEYRGIELTAEDERDCVRKAAAGSHRIFMRDGHVVIRLTFIDKPVKLTRERTYRFGIQAFPAKPLVRKAGYMGTSCHIDPRTAAYSGGKDKALLTVDKVRGAKDAGTLEWSAYWDFDPQQVHPDYHVRELFAQNLVALGGTLFSYRPDQGFLMTQKKKTVSSPIPAPRLEKGWHTAALTWRGGDFTLRIDGREAARFQGAPLGGVNKIVFGKSAMAIHADFHYEAVRFSRSVLPAEELGKFDKTPETLFLRHFGKEGLAGVRTAGEVRQVATDRGKLPSTAAEHFTRLDALVDAGFRSYKGYLNRIFQFYGPQPIGYRNQPYTNEEGYEALGKLLAEMKRRGLTFYFGYSFGVRTGSREDRLYRDFYSVRPAALYGSPITGFWYMCAGCRDYNDFMLYYFNDLMERYGNLGIYTDNTFVCGRLCMNEAHGCGYRDADDGNTLKPSGNLIKGRAFAKRLYALTKLRPVVREHFMHSSSCNHAVFLSWADKYLCGEQYLENKDRKGWNIDLAQFRGQNDITRAFGVPAVVIPTFVPFGHRGMLAVAGLHDCATYGGQQNFYPKDVDVYRPFLQATTRFRTWEAEFIPYYDNQDLVTTNQSRRFYASLWRKPGQVLVQVSNLNWENHDVAVRLDRKKLGLKDVARDAVTGEVVKFDGDTVTLRIPWYDCRLLLVESTTDKSR